MTRANLRTYTSEFRAEAVKLVLGQGLSLEEAGQRLAIPKGTLGNWVSATKRGPAAASAPGSRSKRRVRSAHRFTIGRNVKSLSFLIDEMVRGAHPTLAPDALRRLCLGTMSAVSGPDARIRAALLLMGHGLVLPLLAYLTLNVGHKLWRTLPNTLVYGKELNHALNIA